MCCTPPLKPKVQEIAVALTHRIAGMSRGRIFAGGALAGFSTGNRKDFPGWGQKW